jgi:glycosyltransferase involved in cell wall biosynthesis
MSEGNSRCAEVTPAASVVIATYNRANSVVRLLRALDHQTLPTESFEVIVVDDESAMPVGPVVERAGLARMPRVIRQPNGGPAAARDTGIRLATGRVIVVLDDDMIVAPKFLAEHVAMHAGPTRSVVLGRLGVPKGHRLQLFERMQLALLDRLFDEVAAGRQRPAGKDVYTGNVSFLRDDYLAVGGFDRSLRLSEDAELGMRLERAGAQVVLSERAAALHASDHASLSGWMRRSIAYGAADAAIARKHGVTPATNVWRYLFLVHPVSRVFLLASALAPSVMVPAAQVAMWVAIALGALGLESVALAGATFAYGILYFAGVRRDAGSRGACLHDLRRFARSTERGALGRVLSRFGD